MKINYSPLFPFLAALAFIPALAQATALSDLTAATATNAIDNGNSSQVWKWNSLTTQTGLALSYTGTSATGGSLLNVSFNGVNSGSNVFTYAGSFNNFNTGTGSQNLALQATAGNGTGFNYAMRATTQGTNAGDSGVLGLAIGTSGATYGVYGNNYSPAGYAAYFESKAAGGYAAAFMGGNVGIGTATPVNLLDIGTSGGIHIASGVPVGTSMALYNNSGTLTWNGTALATGSSVSGTTNYVPVYTGASSLGNSVIYQSGGNVGIGTTTPTGVLEVDTSGSGYTNTWDFNNGLSGQGPTFFLSNNNSGGRAMALTAGTGGTALVFDNGANFYLMTDTKANITGHNLGNTSTVLLTFSSGGNVGIGNTSPSYTLQVNGSVAGTSAYVNTSDIRLKKNVQPLDAGLNVVAQLKPVIFEWKDAALKRSKVLGPDGKSQVLPMEDRRPIDPAMQGKQMGFIAQDVEKILPSVVVTEANTDKTKGMKYSELIPVLVKAIQEQQAQLAKDEAALNKDEATIAAMKAKLGM